MLIGAGIAAPSASTLVESHINTVPFFPSPPSPPDLTHFTATDLEPNTSPIVSVCPTHNSNVSRTEPPSNPRTPFPPPVTSKLKKGYAPAKPSPKSLMHTIRAVTHNTEKKPSTRFLLQHFKERFDIVFLQELRKKPLLPHVYNQKGHRAVVFSNLSPHHEHGSGLAFSPLLSQFITPCDNPDKDGLISAALLTLPGSPPLLGPSVYAPAGEVWRRKVETSLRPLLKQFPNFLLRGDFNCLINPVLDSQGLLNDNHWPWIRHSATATPPLLGDTFRLANPTAREYTRYPQEHRTSSSRLDYIIMSWTSLGKISLLEASIHSENRSTDHHPPSCTLSVTPSPFHPSTITGRVFRKLNKSEISTFNGALQEMSEWCQSFSPLIKTLPLLRSKNTPPWSFGSSALTTTTPRPPH